MCWLYALGLFLLSACTHRHFSFLPTVLTYLTSGMVTWWVMGRQRRLLWAVILHFSGFSFMAAIALDAMEEPLQSVSHLQLLLTAQPLTAMAWLAVSLTVFLQALVWWIGSRRMRQPPEYYPACTGFNVGVTVFGIVLLTMMIMRIKGGLAVDGTAVLSLFPAFFIFSLLAIGLARHKTPPEYVTVSSFGVTAGVMTMTLVVVLLATAGALLFMPYLTLVADTGYGIMKRTAAPWVPLMVRLLRFIFGYNKFHPDLPGSRYSDTPLPNIAEGVNEYGIGGTVVLWGMVVLYGVGTVVFFAWLIVFLLRKLIKKHPPVTRPSEGQLLLTIWLYCRELFARLIASLARIPTKFTRRGIAAEGLITRLDVWGRRSGVTRLPSETPGEYGHRLSSYFLPLRFEIGFLIDSFHIAVYGGAKLDPGRILRIKRTLRRLKSPAIWPLRFRQIFFRPESDSWEINPNYNRTKTDDLPR